MSKRPVLVGLGVAAAYYAAAEFGLLLALVEGTVTPLWPPTGIAVFALLRWGMPMAPFISLAAFAVNLPLADAPLTAGMIAVGNVAAPVAAYGMLRAIGFTGLDRLRDGVALIGLGAILAMGISATVGAGTLVIRGIIPASAFLESWSVWWTGDAMGVLVVAPVLLTADRRRWELIRVRAVEASVVLTSSALVTHLVFRSHLRLLYLVFPLLVWAALRLEQAGASLVGAIAIVSATVAAGNGVGPFARADLLDEMLTLQVFNACVAFTAFVLSIIVAERRGALALVTRAGEMLEQRVDERTAELEGANKQLRELDQMKDAFMSAVSHELRTPLTVVRGMAETLRRDEVRDKVELQAQLLERLSVNAIRLERLLEDLLNLDRLRRGVLEPQRREVAVAAVARAILESVETQGRPLRLEGEVVANVDPSQVERIVENLVINAVKHTPVGTHIWVRLLRDADGVLIVVEDDGPGIDPAHAVDLFEPFVRGDTPEHAPGTGIGLSLVWRFAKAHGGHAWVEERLGGGASFRVSLPDRALEQAPVLRIVGDSQV